jgi:hypothetical protein
MYVYSWTGADCAIILEVIVWKSQLALEKNMSIIEDSGLKIYDMSVDVHVPLSYWPIV